MPFLLLLTFIITHTFLASAVGAEGVGSPKIVNSDRKRSVGYETAKRHLEQAKADFFEGRYSQALTILQNISYEEPENALCHLYLGRCYLKLRSLAAAIRELNLAREENPVFVNDTSIELALAYLNENRFEDAISWCEYCKKRSPAPQEIESIEQRAKTLATIGDPKKPNYLTPKDHLRWTAEQMPLRVRIDAHNFDAQKRAEFVDSINQALKSWSLASNGVISFKIVTSPDEDILFQLSREPVMVDGKRNGGCTTLHAQESDSFYSYGPNEAPPTAEQIAQMAATQPAPHAGHATCLIGSAPDKTFQAVVVMHETGHALGLSDHSNNFGDVMRDPALSLWLVRKLSARDRNSIQTMYSREPN